MSIRQIVHVISCYQGLGAAKNVLEIDNGDGCRKM